MTPDQIDRDQLRDYARRFINRWDYVFIGTPSGQWRCCRQALTEEHLRQAVAGRISLGAYAVDRRGMSRWACLDLDDNVRGDRFTDIIAGLPDPDAALLEYSRRGFHLWLFVEPSPWFVVQHWAKTQADRAGLTGIEVFPKSDGLNGVRLPLSLHPKSRQTYPLIDPTSGEVIEDPLTFIGSALTHLPAGRGAGAIAGPTGHHPATSRGGLKRTPSTRRGDRALYPSCVSMVPSKRSAAVPCTTTGIRVWGSWVGSGAVLPDVAKEDSMHFAHGCGTSAQRG